MHGIQGKHRFKDRDMIKKELIKAVSDRTGLLPSEVQAVIDATLETVTTSLQNGEPVIIRNFGTFKIEHKNAKTGYDFHTRTSISIPDTYRPILRFSKELISDINCCNQCKRRKGQ